MFGDIIVDRSLGFLSRRLTNSKGLNKRTRLHSLSLPVYTTLYAPQSSSLRSLYVLYYLPIPDWIVFPTIVSMDLGRKESPVSLPGRRKWTEKKKRRKREEESQGFSLASGNRIKEQNCRDQKKRGRNVLPLTAITTTTS